MTEVPVGHKRKEDAKLEFEHRRKTDTGILGWIYRNLPVVGYIVLAVAIAFAIGSVRHEGVQRRTGLANNARHVVLEGCQRDNDTRAILRGLILDGNKQIKQYEHDHLITHTQARRARAANAKAASKLPPVNCQAQIEKLETE